MFGKTYMCMNVSRLVQDVVWMLEGGWICFVKLVFFGLKM